MGFSHSPNMIFSLFKEIWPLVFRSAEGMIPMDIREPSSNVERAQSVIFKFQKIIGQRA